MIKRHEIDIETLRYTCNMPIKDFRSLGEFVPCEKNGSGYTYIDNGSPILAVAHLDTVQKSQEFFYHNGIVFSPRLDDRLGVDVILNILPMFGLKYDILLTENEEREISTARYFTPNKAYNWIFEFDRGGEQSVLYQYNRRSWRKALERSGINIGIGTYSDIADLEFLGVCGVNIATGYFNFHSKIASAVINLLLDSTLSFMDFYRLNKDIKYEYKKHFWTH